MAAIDNIVTLGISDDDTSTSGYTLMAAAGMSPINLDKIASELYVQGATLANKKKQLAINAVRNDFLGFLQANDIATTVANPTYNTAGFSPGIDLGFYNGLRGTNIHRVTNYRKRLSKTKITGIQCYPLVDHTGEIIIQDTINGVLKDIPFDVVFVANKINTFSVDHVIQNQYASVLIDNTSVKFASSPIICGQGCSGSTPNPCGWADGWNGANNVKGEGFGINVIFNCFCDYDQVLCDMDKVFSGELIWLKWQELVFDEQRKTNRFNAWVVYEHKELDKIVADIRNQYNQRFNDLSAGLFNILKNYRDECLICHGIRTVVNL